jgi:hypothetical protein
VPTHLKRIFPTTVHQLNFCNGRRFGIVSFAVFHDIIIGKVLRIANAIKTVFEKYVEVLFDVKDLC